MYFLAESDEFIRLLDKDALIPIIAIVLGCGIAIIAIIAKTISKVSIAKAQENSRRELAAYIAEGTMAPADAVALMNAGNTGGNLSEQDSMKA